MPAGRPTSYDPAFCERVIEYGRQGKSKTWIAAALDVHRDTINEWERVHPDFSDAMARAKQFEQMWWEDAGQDGMRVQGFGQSIWSRSMAARFPTEWREKVAHVGDKTEDPIQQEVTITADAFTRRIAGAAARAREASASEQPADSNQS